MKQNKRNAELTDADEFVQLGFQQLERLSKLGYLYLYFDELKPVDEWIVGGKDEESSRALDSMFGPATPATFEAIPVKTRDNYLDRSGWLSVPVNSGEAKQFILASGKEIVVRSKFFE